MNQGRVTWKPRHFGKCLQYMQMDGVEEVPTCKLNVFHSLLGDCVTKQPELSDLNQQHLFCSWICIWGKAWWDQLIPVPLGIGWSIFKAGTWNHLKAPSRVHGTCWEDSWRPRAPLWLCILGTSSLSLQHCGFRAENFLEVGSGLSRCMKR